MPRGVTRLAAALLVLLAPSAASASDDRPGRVYIITVAAQPEPGVFATEAHLAARVLAQRYRTAVAPVVLEDAGGARAATRRGLSAALKRAGAALRPTRDVVVIYWAGHGLKNGVLKLEGGGQKDRVTAADLNKMLDDAGVGAALIVVSACYAGAMIPTLQRRERVIITAARAERSSFGCRASDRLTFFGAAFLDDNAMDAPSLSAAHDVAKDRIRRLEAVQEKPRSFPQRFLGVEGLARLERCRRPAPVR